MRKYITLDWLKSQGACKIALRAFEERYGSHRIPVNWVVAACQEQDYDDWAAWLMWGVLPSSLRRKYENTVVQISNRYAWPVYKEKRRQLNLRYARLLMEYGKKKAGKRKKGK